MEVILYYRWVEGKTGFYERTEQGEYVPRTDRYKIKTEQWTTEQDKQRMWLMRDYEASLQAKAHKEMDGTHYSEVEFSNKMTRLSSRYGEITIPVKKADSKNLTFTNQTLIYSDQFGLKEQDK